ncbi:MAG: ATP-binding cassette domain-containing protein [Baekduia sp.]
MGKHRARRRSRTASAGSTARPRARGRARGALDAARARAPRPRPPVGEFSIAEQQVIEIARALLAEPRVLVMDEPTSSLTQADTEKLFDVVGQLSAHGVSVIYISHFLEEVRRVAAPLHRAQGRRRPSARGEVAATSQDRDRTPDGWPRRGPIFIRHRSPRVGEPLFSAAGRRDLAGACGRDPRALPG